MVDNIIKENFNEYINNINNENIIKIISNNLQEMPNIIIYGPSGTGKYTLALNIINKFSKSNLKYNKKILIQTSKIDIYIKISDIHFEIDMELLGCNSKLVWNDIFYNIIDIISSNDNRGIILCKNFHNINNELLEIFYSYMQKDIFANYNIKFILITDNISFISNNILNTCKIISQQKFSKSYYKKKFNNSINYINYNNIDISNNIYNDIEEMNYLNNSNDININNINNLKILKIKDINSKELDELMLPYSKICDSIIDIILNANKEINFSDLRQTLYDILVYNLNIYDSIFYILKTLINKKKIKNIESINNNLLENTYIFFKYYNNNYRPIYHLENYILYLIKQIHEL